MPGDRRYGGEHVRHLTERLLLGALRRGCSVEQFLGACGTPHRPGVRHAEVRPADGRFEVWLHEAEDVGGENFLDLTGFPPLDPDDEETEFGRLLGTARDPAAALRIAAQHCGTGPERWVNQGVVQDEYRDFVRAGRPGSPREGR